MGSSKHVYIREESVNLYCCSGRPMRIENLNLNYNIDTCTKS